MFGLLFGLFIGQRGPKFSCAKAQTLPNLRLWWLARRKFKNHSRFSTYFTSFMACQVIELLQCGEKREWIMHRATMVVWDYISLTSICELLHFPICHAISAQFSPAQAESGRQEKQTKSNSTKPNVKSPWSTCRQYRASHVLLDWVLLTWIWDVPPPCLGSR